MSKASLGSGLGALGSFHSIRRSLCHCNVVRSVLGLRAHLLVNIVLGGVHAKLSVHVPSELLACSLRVSKLLLGQLVKSVQLLLEHFKFFLLLFESGSRLNFNCRGLLGDCNNYTNTFPKSIPLQPKDGKKAYDSWG